MTDKLENLNRHDRLLLRMEDVLENRIELEREFCDKTDRDLNELYDGECESCGRVYEVTYLVDHDYQTDPHSLRPEKGDCIPCWRKKHNLPKIDRDLPEEPLE